MSPTKAVASASGIQLSIELASLSETFECGTSWATQTAETDCPCGRHRGVCPSSFGSA